MNINVEKCDKHPAQHNNVYQFTVVDSLAEWAFQRCFLFGPLRCRDLTYLEIALSLEWKRIRIQTSRQDEFLWGMKCLSFDRMMLSRSTGCYAKLVSCKCQMLGAAASLQQKTWKRGFFLCKFSCWMSQNPSQHFATRKVHGS